ncbi:hypothetical protein GGR88_000904 [Sphingomonas jejuensis]|uniref:XapX domain-containing protein n=1 Tax=Sphingomonas jejuensis TaxID=904715 RepID=A0ABX0XJL6_9SPHN|nr:hypothetical protein [Sphingomonas jejuensis]
MRLFLFLSALVASFAGIAGDLRARVPVAVGVAAVSGAIAIDAVRPVRQSHLDLMDTPQRRLDVAPDGLASYPSVIARVAAPRRE